ncbi:hypothetical protein D9Q98_004290 [Chlorella vulgaris]|uniref:Uncharacterized protein n=1 Tax=Chlorella vulgaris TaxID=3077 RepID=A0A9D4TRQ8_CHLVU|nr:hypothetical protein D9Q98_004290 [Chlorella vulgaris]
MVKQMAADGGGETGEVRKGGAEETEEEQEEGEERVSAAAAVLCATGSGHSARHVVSGAMQGRAKVAAT